MELLADCGGRSVTIEVQTSDLVEGVRERLAEQAQLPVASSDTWLSWQGRPCLDGATIQGSGLRSGSFVRLHLRLRGGGGDGGSTGAESRASYLEMYAGKKQEKVNPAEAKRAQWTQCRLSAERLQPPCCSDELGSLFNKDAVVTALVTKAMPKSLSHITSLKHLIDLRLTPTETAAGSAAAAAAGSISTIPSNEADFCCPVTGAHMNGRAPFVILPASGLVVSERAFKQAPEAVQELAGADALADPIPVNPPTEDFLLLREKLVAKRAALKAKKDSKKASKALAAAVPEAVAGALAAAVQQSGGVQAAAVKLQKRPADDLLSPSLLEQVKSKKFKATDVMPAHASEKVWKSIFTGGRVAQETYSCRSNSARGMKL